MDMPIDIGIKFNSLHVNIFMRSHVPTCDTPCFHGDIVGRCDVIENGLIMLFFL